MRARPAWIRSVPALVLVDLRRRYAGSILGGLWALLTPLLEVAAWAVVFGLFMKPPGQGPFAYAVFVASGLLPWAAFRESLESSASALPDNRWIRRSRVPMELLLARGALLSTVRVLVAVVLVLSVAGADGFVHGLAGSLLPLLAVGIQLTASYGASLAIAPLSTLHPDLRPVLGSVLTLLMFASPILYPESALGPAARAVFECNPFTHLLRLYRFPLSPDPGLLVRDLAFTIGTAAALLLLGRAVKRGSWWKARDAL